MGKNFQAWGLIVVQQIYFEYFVCFDYFDNFEDKFNRMRALIDIPSKVEKQQARAVLSEMERVSGKGKTMKKNAVFSVKVGESEASVKLTGKMFVYFRLLLEQMAEGHAVQVVPLNDELGTQEAADLLNVSRPFLVKLLEEGKIPFKKVGSHRRVLLRDIQEYQRAQQSIREKQLDFLSSQAQALNLGY